MKCSECKAELNAAGYCTECGFSLPKSKAPNAFNPESPQAKCSHEGCYLPAILKVKTPTGWANLCDFHDAQAHQARANANSARLGLVTVADHRAWLRANAGKGFKRFGANGIEPTHDDSAQREIARQVAYGEVTANREPGSDFEEDAA